MKSTIKEARQTDFCNISTSNTSSDQQDSLMIYTNSLATPLYNSVTVDWAKVKIPGIV